MVNVDMVGPLGDAQLVVNGVGTAAPFASMLAQAAEQSPLKVDRSSAAGITPGDDAPFMVKGIPSLCFHAGMDENDRRPTAADKNNYSGEAKAIDLIAQVIVAISRTDRRQLGFIARAAPTTQSSDRR
jgi:hypothetical protein